MKLELCPGEAHRLCRQREMQTLGTCWKVYQMPPYLEPLRGRNKIPTLVSQLSAQKSLPSDRVKNNHETSSPDLAPWTGLHRL